MKPALACVWLLFACAAASAQAVIYDTHPPVYQHSYHHDAIRRFAIPSSNQHYFGYWVGGGALSRKRGEPAYDEEGTWGWDYRGWLIPRRVDLLWWHGRRYQGGSGAYKTDGPHLPHLPHKESHEGHK